MGGEGLPAEGPLGDVLTNGGELAPLPPDEIDALCERINGVAAAPEFFVVTRLSRADLEARGFDASSLSDDMGRFAEKMGDGYTSSGLFWDQIDIIAQEEFGLTRSGACAWCAQPLDPKVAGRCSRCGALLCQACAEGVCLACATQDSESGTAGDEDKPVEEQRKAVVEVSGGVAQVTECPEGVRVAIIDYDNLDAESVQLRGER
jgi:hypothetical protein